eukprot:s1067_g3.t1
MTAHQRAKLYRLNATLCPRRGKAPEPFTEAVYGSPLFDRAFALEERATILAEVYGKPDDSMEELGDIGDEAALERAWKAIERAASSDEEFDEVELQPRASEDAHLSQETLHAIRGSRALQGDWILRFSVHGS